MTQLRHFAGEVVKTFTFPFNEGRSQQYLLKLVGLLLVVGFPRTYSLSIGLYF